MIRDLSDKEIKYLVGLISGDGIVTAEKTKLIKHLEQEKFDRELVNTSCTIYRDQKEYAESQENASLFYRTCIDYYLASKVNKNVN